MRQNASRGPLHLPGLANSDQFPHYQRQVEFAGVHALHLAPGYGATVRGIFERSGPGSGDRGTHARATGAAGPVEVMPVENPVQPFVEGVPLACPVPRSVLKVTISDQSRTGDQWRRRRWLTPMRQRVVR